MKRFLVFVLAAAFASATPYVIPTNRIPPSLQPGVVTGVIGGIPARTHGLNATLPPYNADNTGATDCTTAIGNALAAVASSGGTYDFVYLPSRGGGVPGIYRIDAEFGMPNNVTIRGDGVGEPGDAGLTILDGRHSGQHVVDIGNTDPAFGTGVNTTIAVGLTDGMTRGSTRLKVGSTSGFVVGRFVRIQIPNETDPSGPVFQVESLNPYVRYLVRKVTNVVDGTHFDVTPAIPGDFNFSAIPVQQAISAPAVGISVEDLQVDGANAGSPLLYEIFAGYTEGCWLRNVKCTNYNNAGVFWDLAINCEIRHCRVEGSVSGGTNHGGFLIQNFTGGLIEDNIGVLTNPCLEFNFGADTTLISYNYLDQSIGSALDIHNGWMSFIGIEGNFLSNTSLDSYFEGSSEVTYFRNWSPALFNNPDAPIQGFGFAVNRFNRRITLIGNISNSQGYSWNFNGYGLGDPPGGQPQGAVTPSTGTFWHDYDEVAQRPRLWTGTLTTRTDNVSGVITLDSGMAASLRIALDLAHETNNVSLLSGVTPFGKFHDRIHIYDLTGDVASFDGGSGVNPAQGSPVAAIGGSPGFYEHDNDVELSALQVDNWTWKNPAGIISGQALDPGVTLPNSIAYTTTPAWWPGDLSWPPYDPSNATGASASSTPAGRRFFLTVPPAITGGGITAEGDRIVVGINKGIIIKPGGGGTGGWTVSASGVTATFDSIVGTTIVLRTSRTFANDESVSLTYNAPAPAGFVDSNGNGMPSKSSFGLQNGSALSPAGQTWYYSAPQAAVDGVYTYQFSGTTYLSPIVIDKPGIITKASIKWGNVVSNDHQFKFAVFDGGNNYVTQNFGAYIVTPPSPDIAQIVVMGSAHVTAGTYNAGVNVFANSDPQMATVSGVGAGAFKIYFTTDWASFPPSNIGAPSATQTQSLVVGLLLTPDDVSAAHVTTKLHPTGTIKLPP